MLNLANHKLEELELRNGCQLICLGKGTNDENWYGFYLKDEGVPTSFRWKSDGENPYGNESKDIVLKQPKTNFSLDHYFNEHSTEPQICQKLDKLQVTNGELASLIKYTDPTTNNGEDYHALIIDNYAFNVIFVRFYEDGTSSNERYTISAKPNFNLKDYIDKPHLLTFGENDDGEVLFIYELEIIGKNPEYDAVIKHVDKLNPEFHHYFSDGIHWYQNCDELNLRLK